MTKYTVSLLLYEEHFELSSTEWCSFYFVTFVIYI
jgi:hypothetical protein